MWTQPREPNHDGTIVSTNTLCVVFTEAEVNCGAL